MEDKIIKSAVILFVSLIVSRYLPKLIHIPSRIATDKAKTIIHFVKQVLTVVILFFAVLIILNIYGVDMTPYLLSSSIVGFAIAFGAQNYIKDIIAGINLIFEPRIHVGKHVVIDKADGILRKVNLKNIYIETKEGDLFIIPNGEIKTIQIKNPKPADKK